MSMLTDDFSQTATASGVMGAAGHLSQEIPDISSDTVTAQERANIYRFLVTAFLQPVTREFVDNICRIDVLDGLVGLFGEAAIAGIRGYALRSDMDAEAVGQEFMDLFCVPTSRYVMPFEDVYFGMYEDSEGEPIQGPLLGERAIIAQQIYRAAGAKMLEERSELPNHIGIELAFMSFLVEKEVLLEDCLQSPSVGKQVNHSALVAYRKIQRQFLYHHLLSWYPKLNRAIQVNAKTLFYQGLAQFAEAFLYWDLQRLDALAVPEAMPGHREEALA